MTFIVFLKKRVSYYIIFFCFCLFLYMLIPNSTFMGVLIGLIVSEIQTYFEYIDSKKIETKTHSDNEQIKEYPKQKINWIKIVIYIAILLAIWGTSNLYLYLTNN